MSDELFYRAVSAGLAVFVGAFIGLKLRRPEKGSNMLTRVPFLTATISGLIAAVVTIGWASVSDGR